MLVSKSIITDKNLSDYQLNQMKIKEIIKLLIINHNHLN